MMNRIPKGNQGPTPNHRPGTFTAAQNAEAGTNLPGASPREVRIRQVHEQVREALALPEHQRWTAQPGYVGRIDEYRDNPEDTGAGIVVLKDDGVRGSTEMRVADLQPLDRELLNRKYPNTHFAEPSFAWRHERALIEHSDRMNPDGPHDDERPDVTAVTEWSSRRAEPLDITNPTALRLAAREAVETYEREFGTSLGPNAMRRCYELLEIVWQDKPRL
jgi:hypothetical protein